MVSYGWYRVPRRKWSSGYCRPAEGCYQIQGVSLIQYPSHCSSLIFRRFQVSPTELEELIVQHPAVADVGVVGIWDDTESTETPTAFVVPVSDVSPSDYNRIDKEIIQAVASKVAGYKQLRGGVKFIEKLPRNPTGKLLRRELREHGAEFRSKL